MHQSIPVGDGDRRPARNRSTDVRRQAMETRPAWCEPRPDGAVARLELAAGVGCGDGGADDASRGPHGAVWTGPSGSRSSPAFSSWISRSAISRIARCTCGAPMWRFHQIHHSDPFVDVTTTYRTHPVETVWRFAFAIVPIWILGIPAQAVVIQRLLQATNGVLEHAEHPAVGASRSRAVASSSSRRTFTRFTTRARSRKPTRTTPIS